MALYTTSQTQTSLVLVVGASLGGEEGKPKRRYQGAGGEWEKDFKRWWNVRL